MGAGSVHKDNVLVVQAKQSVVALVSTYKLTAITADDVEPNVAMVKHATKESALQLAPPVKSDAMEYASTRKQTPIIVGPVEPFVRAAKFATLGLAQRLAQATFACAVESV